MTAVDLHEQSGTYIDGAWSGAGESFTLIDPAKGTEYATVLGSRPQDVDKAVQAARKTFPAWSKMSPSDRGLILSKWADLVFANLEKLAEIEARNVGKPLSGGRLNLQIAGSVLRYNGGAADKLLGSTLPVRSDEFFGYTVREPYGVCGLILPWNVPALLTASNLAPALAAGNTVVLKPSEVAPLISHALVELGEQAGLPPGVLNVLTGTGADLGAALVGHPDINHVGFVGSVATGRLVMKAAAENLVPVKLELGGKSPNIVFSDANLDIAIPSIVRGITENAGQNCNAGSRVLVDRSIADEVRDRITAEMSVVRIGSWDEDLDMGPLVNETQFNRVSSLVDAAKADGADVLFGGGRVGERDTGYFLQPTVLGVADSSAAVVHQEIFGPVLTVETFGSYDEAVTLANATEFGLLACIWTQDISNALRMSRDVVSGQISVNQFGDAGVIGRPFNVAKKSGFSSGRGYRGLYEFTREKAVAIKF